VLPVWVNLAGMRSGRWPVTAIRTTALAVALVGCAAQPIEAGDFDGGDPASITTTAASATSTTSATQQADPPARSAEANVNSDAGVRAFIRHYVALYNYGRTSDDWQPLRALSSPECKTCGSLMRGQNESGEWRAGQIVVLYDRKPDVAAAEVGMSTDDESEKWTFYFSLARKGDSWTTDRITLIDREG
jgi:Family of unknown function (DUF6318)